MKKLKEAILDKLTENRKVTKIKKKEKKKKK